jgi:TonB family protein
MKKGVKGGRLIPMLAVCLLVALLGPPASHAQDKDLEVLTSRLASKLLKANKKRVAVFGVAGPEGNYTQLGKELGDKLSAALARNAPGLEVVDREKLVRLGPDQGLPPMGLLTPVPGTWIVALAGADVAVTGEMKRKSAAMELSVEAIDVGKNKRITRLKIKVPLTDEMNRLAKVDVCDLELIGARPGVCGLSMPECVRCPNPSYSQAARDAKVQGTIRMVAVLSPDGHLSFMRVTKGIGYGLGEVALNAARDWLLKPVQGRDGKPIAAWVEIEFSFRIY